MKMLSLVFSILLVCQLNSQSIDIDLSRKFDNNSIDAVNREISLSDDGTAIVLNAQPGDGLGYIDGVQFTKGVIQLELKGENNPGKSFVGLAFNIQNDSTFEAIYFRPFNFVAKEAIRRAHMVQYIHHPEKTWHMLRETRTGEFENEIKNPPDPDNWFQARIIIEENKVRVFVNNAKEPSLVIDRLDSHKSDRIGVWTGFNSAGWFRSIKISELP